MEIIFRKKYVNYNQISNITLLEINDLLIDNNLFLDIGDNFCNDWAGFSYYYCKKFNELDDKAISSFVYVITWFMTSNPIEIYSNFKSETYFKNDKILLSCLNIYRDILNYCDSNIEICKELFERIYLFYTSNYKNYLKRSERMNCLLTYKDMMLFNNVEGKSRSDKLKTLLDNYYK